MDNIVLKNPTIFHCLNQYRLKWTIYTIFPIEIIEKIIFQ